MKFTILRTSSYDMSSPHPKAKLEKVEYWHIRTVSEEEYNKKFSQMEGLWHSRGKNHSVTQEGFIKRQEEDRETWTIKIKDLKELIVLSEECRIIVRGVDETTNLPSIEIYDDYRE